MIGSFQGDTQLEMALHPYINILDGLATRG